MKKKILSIVLLVVALNLVGCGAEKSDEDAESVEVWEEAESVETGEEVQNEKTDIEKFQEQFPDFGGQLSVEEYIDENTMKEYDANGVDTSNWTVSVSDYSTSNLYIKIAKMSELYDLFKKGTTITNRDDMDINGTCMVWTYEFNMDSDWVRMFGTSTINDVYRAYGLPEYGVYRCCTCAHLDKDENVNELLISLGLATKGDLEASKISGGVNRIPLDKHVIYSMSREELVDWLANSYVYSMYGDGLGWNDTQTLYYSKFLFTLYGTSVEEIEDKFSIYFSYESDIRDVYSVYLNSDYPGNVFEFYLEDISVLDAYMAKYMNEGLQNASEEQKSEIVITNYQADILTRYGYEVPSFATRVE